MAKTRTHAPKPGFAVGLDFDAQAIRAARLSADGQGGFAVDRLEEVHGDFAEDGGLIEGIREAKDKVRIGPKDLVVSCLAGKQVSASQITFRKLPPEEMEPALRLQMRKSVTFEVAGATLDYQVLDGGDPKAETVQVLVGLAAGGMLGRQLKVLEKAGVKPATVDLLPVAAANALWTWLGAAKGDYPHVALHIGPQLSTIVIDGPKSPFFNRYIYFAAEEVLGTDGGPGDQDKRARTLGEEVARSLAFYEKSAFAGGFPEINLLGEYLESKVLEDQLRRHTGLPVRRMDIPRKLGFAHGHPPGRFDLAVALAMRGTD